MNNIFRGRIKIYSLFIISSILLHTLFWFIFLWFFVILSSNTTNNDILYSFYLNLKFNLRLTMVILLPLILISIFPINFFNTKILKKIAIIYTSLAFIMVFIIHIMDLAHYSYLGKRIDATIFKFLENLKISLVFVYESYPVLWLLFLTIIFSGIFYFFTKKIFSKNNLILVHRKKLYKIISSILVFFIILLGIFGKLSQYPLRWSEVFFSQDKGINALSLNPILNIFDTYKYMSSNFIKLENINEKKELLQKDIVSNKIYTNSSNPNIIVVMLESLGINHIGFMGSNINPTPNLDKLAKNGYIFTNFFVPIRSTSRSVFTSLFGIPDVSTIRTASRNPFIKKQYSLVNDLVNYKKHYFIGGSLSWANIRGVLNKFIPDMELFEGEYHSDYSNNDVWGISDRSLFKEAHKKLESLGSKKEPFFAYIQTAGNHRPFTIPKKNTDYKIKKWSKEKLNKNAFIEQNYFNGVNLLDFSIGEFIENFKKSSYYENTIIVFFGDHGDNSTKNSFMNPSYFDLSLFTYHIPLIIYSPSLIKKPKIFTRTSSLLDMLPTIFSIAKLNFKNKTLGVNLLNKNNKRHTAFIVNIGLIKDNLFLQINNNKLYDINTNKIIENKKEKEIMKNLFNSFKDISQNALYGNISK